MSSDRVVRKQLRAWWLARSSVQRWLIVVVAGLAGFLLIAYVVLKLAPDWFAETENLDAKSRADARQGVRTASLALLAGAIGVIGAFYTARTFALNRAGQLTDRFTKAIEQLGHEIMDVRLGGIYALERIARDSKDDHPQVVEVLTAYVRDHAPLKETLEGEDDGQESPVARSILEGSKPDTDVQAALTVLGRRTVAHEQKTAQDLNLSSTDLSGADLKGANLSRAWLWRVNLTNAFLENANLSRAYLTGAHLPSARLEGANLRRTDLAGVNLEGAIYNGATTWPMNFDPAAAGARESEGE
jgi:hypothetical protein